MFDTVATLGIRDKNIGNDSGPYSNAKTPRHIPT